MSPIKDFIVSYEASNEKGFISQGDTIAGTVTFTLSKETVLKVLVVKVKGNARVHWTEGTGDRRKSRTAHRRYLKLKEYLVPENDKGTALPKGANCFKFRFTIPQEDMPSSFKGFHGRIVYMLEAKMSRSWRPSSVVQQELKFMSKSLSHPGSVMCPQSGSVEKDKGKVQMSATVNMKVCSPGDTLTVVAKIRNSSSKKLKPKVSLQQRIVYRAEACTDVSDLSLYKMEGDTITSGSEETFSCQVKIPGDANCTIQNCEILSVEHYVKVYLDISFAIDPEVKFPLVIIHSSLAALQSGQAVGPYPAGVFGAPTYTDFPPPAFPPGPYPVLAGPGAYGYPAPDPSQHANMTSGYNNQWPQPAAPYGFSNAASPPFQQGTEPPPYMSIFSPPQDDLGRTGSDYKNQASKGKQQN
ncbi:arrestin domain-containing protein 3-like [Gymnodraco acuticeps]|uniref:Arrestin domain-containing protein 3-like n=1 Tax=Gymnodraco acuticeps TaxID=8218 RepID=A0A6P8WAT2_GYMAC|nr:arrestin domain-containing protein 3-like [Gymnodraco acuticeps]